MATFPWTAWPKSMHEELIALLRAKGPLPEDAIMADLVYLANEAGHPNASKKQAFPGRRALHERWGVSDRTARRMLASQDWKDTCYALGIAQPRPVPVGVPRAYPQQTEQRQVIHMNEPTTVPVGVHTRVDRSSDPPILKEEEEAEPDRPTLRVVNNSNQEDEVDIEIRGLKEPDPKEPTMQQVADLMGLQLRDDLTTATPSDFDWAAVRRWLRRGHSPESLARTWEFHMQQDWWKDHEELRRWSSLLNKNAEARIAEAAEAAEKQEAETRKAIAEESEMDRRMADYRAMKARQAAKRAEREAAK